MEFVGMVIDRQGVRSAEDKIAAVAQLAPPVSVEELRAFFGMTGYLRQFVERYSIVAAPLTDVPRNKPSHLHAPDASEFRGRSSNNTLSCPSSLP